jgi:hypothetical protein
MFGLQSRFHFAAYKAILHSYLLENKGRRGNSNFAFLVSLRTFPGNIAVTATGNAPVSFFLAQKQNPPTHRLIETKGTLVALMIFRLSAV